MDHRRAEVGFDSHCYNCARGLCVNGVAAVCREGGRYFCSSNCRWACLLDVKGARIRAAKRAREKKPSKKGRRRRLAVEVDVDDRRGDEDDRFGGDGGNAMFGYHVYLGTDLQFDSAVSFR